MHFSRRLSSVITIFSLLIPSFAHGATKAYVTNGSSNTVSILNLATNQIANSINVGGATWGAAINGTGAYIALINSDLIKVFDTTDDQLVTTISAGDGPIYIAFYGTGAYITNVNADTVSVIDTTNFLIERTISVGDNPSGIVSSGTGMYVANNGANTVSVIDVTTNTVEQTITVGTNPYEIATSGTGVYVANQNSGTVSIIDRSNNIVEGSVSVGANPIAIAISGTGAYVANSGGNNVSIIDISNRLVERTVAVGNSPGGVGISGTGAYILNRLGSISIIDTTNGLVETTISGLTNPLQMAIASDSVTVAPTLTIPSSVEECQDLSIEYSLPEIPLAGSVELQFYNVLSHVSVRLTLSNSTGASFLLDTQNIIASSNIISISGGSSLAIDDNYIVYLSYQDQFGNAAADTDEDLFLALCQPSSSSSSFSSSSSVTVEPHGGGGGRPTITPEYILKVSQERFGSSSSSSSSSSRSPLTIGGMRYDDVMTDTWYATFVRKIIELQIFEGYKMPDGTPLNKFGPADPITLGQLAKVGTILWDKKDIEPRPKGNEWFAPYIAKVKSVHLSAFNGEPNALAHATRAQVVQTVIEALGFPIKQGTSPFTDVSVDHPNAQAIITASMLGFIKGDEGTNSFRPDEPINRAEVAKVLSLALGHVGINYIDDMLSAKPTSSSTGSVPSASSASFSQSSSSKEALKPATGKDIRYVTTPTLSVRSDARITSTVLWMAKQGQEFEVLRIVANDWAHVRVSDGNEGYVWAASLGN